MSVSDIVTNNQQLSAAGPGNPAVVFPFKLGLNPASIICILSAGAALTYSVEVTGDDITAQGYSAATGNWIALQNFSALTASATGTLGAVVTGIRPHVTSYTSGSLTFQFVQYNRT